MQLRRLLGAALAALAVTTAATGCGAQRPGVGMAVGVAGVQWVGQGAEALAEPALARLASGEVLLVGVTDAVGARRLQAATSPDGKRFGALAPVEAGAAYTDQSPALVARPEGGADLYFVSNRDGADFELFHADFEDGAFSAPERVPGFTGAQAVSAARAGSRVAIAAEVMGEGLFFAERAGEAFGAPEQLADAGFEPALAAVGGSRFGVAYQRAGVIHGRLQAEGGAFGAERELARGEGRLRLPALAWSGSEGHLLYGERTSGTYALRAQRLDTNFAPIGARKVPVLPGEARKIALILDDNNSTGVLAWAHKGATGPQGVAIATY